MGIAARLLPNRLHYYCEFADVSYEEETLKRRGRTVVSVLGASAVLAALLVLTTCSLGAAAASGQNESAKKLLAGSMAAAQKESGCTYTTTFTLDGHPYVLAARAGVTEGEQLISYDGAQIDLREIAGAIYIYANAAGVKLQFEEADPTWANRWIVVTPSDAKFKDFSSGILLMSTLSEVPPAKLTAKPQSGAGSIEIAGKPNTTIGLSAGKEKLYLSAASPNLPEKLVVTDKPPSEVRKLTITFSHWGRAVAVSTPPGATPLSKTSLPD